MRTNPDRNFSSIFKGLSKILRLTESDCNKTNKHVKIPSPYTNERFIRVKNKSLARVKLAPRPAWVGILALWGLLF